MFVRSPDRAPPRLGLSISPLTLTSRPARLESLQDLIVDVVWGEMHAELESRRANEPHERGQRRLTEIPFVGGDHRGRHPGSLCELPLTEAALETCELEDPSCWRVRIRLCHNTIVSSGSLRRARGQRLPIKAPIRMFALATIDVAASAAFGRADPIFRL